MSEKEQHASYEDSVREIEDILAAIEGDDLPIDELAPMVERAAELLAACRATLQQTEVRVAEAIDALRDEPEEDAWDE